MSVRSDEGRRGLRIIAIFKLVKASLLVLLAVGALSVLHKDVASVLTSLISQLGADPHDEYFHRLLVLAGRQSPAELKLVSAGSFFYAVLFATEGIGLMMRKRWAEYFTAILTGSFLPLEIYEFALHPTIFKTLVIAANIGIVAYLVMELKRTAHRKDVTT